jgi:hypothetical protein
MRHAPSMLASLLCLAAISTSGFGDAAGREVQPDLRSSKWMQPSIGDTRRAERTDLRLSRFFDPPSAVRADAKVLLAQAKLPSLREVNLLAPDQGGQALVIPNDEWFKPISGKETDYASVSKGQEAVYAFKDERPAVFSKFSILIAAESEHNPKQIEVLVGDDSPTGMFRSVGILNTVNAKIVKSPYQELSFSETTARFIKIKILESHWSGGISLGQIRLLGTIK